MYCALIGDIINSKEIDDREYIQQRLSDCLGKINVEFSHDIAAKFIITLGDEFQGLLLSTSNLLNIIEKVKASISPAKIRFGIGFGEVTTQINREMAIGADGPAFYAARQAIDLLKRNKRKYKTLNQLQYFVVYNINNSNITLINATFALCSQIENHWTKRQREIIFLVKKYNNNQSYVANDLGINKSSVQKSLVASEYYCYTNALKAIQESISDIWDMMRSK